MSTASHVLPMLCCILPSACTLQHRRGERIWEPRGAVAQAEEQSEEKLLEQMKGRSHKRFAQTEHSECSEMLNFLDFLSLESCRLRLLCSALTLAPPPLPSSAAAAAASSSSASSTPNGSPSKLSKKERKAAQKLLEQSNAAKRQAAATLVAAANSAKGGESGAESAAAAATAVAALSDSSVAASCAASPSKCYWADHPSELSTVLDGVSAAGCGSSGLEFGAECSSKDRVIIHTAAASRGLDHESLGFRPRRHLYVTPPWDRLPPHALLLAFRMGHLYLEGPAIDAIGSRRSVRVDADPSFRAHRASRDGVHYHATLVHSSSVEWIRQNWPECLRGARREFEKEGGSASAAGAAASAAAPSAAACSSAAVATAASPSPADDDHDGVVSTRVAEEILLRFFAARLSSFAEAVVASGSGSSCGPVELGLGRASKDGCVAFYRVLAWPEVDRIRAELGLDPHDFHVTVGFKTADVHGVKKDASTLCELEDEQAQDENR